MTELLGIRYPIIGAPMFLVSNEAMVAAVSNAGGIGSFPALNFRPIDRYEEALKKVKSLTDKPISVNIIVNKSNLRQNDDLKIALKHGVNLFITSLGSPKTVIEEAHKNGAKVFCDVTNLEHALKVQELGADGVIAVASGAGGHAGPITPFVLVPWLKKELEIPIILAGGIADGHGLAAALSLGASGVSVGTRFIASKEASVDQAYKDAIVKSTPEDIVMSTRVSGTPASVINTEYVQKIGTDLPIWLELLKKNPKTKKYVVPLIHMLGMRTLEEAASKPTWKTVWSAGQTVGLIHDIPPCAQIVESIVSEYQKIINELPKNN